MSQTTPDMQLRLSASGRFQCRIGADGEFADAKVRPCFPLSDPGRWYSLHDDEGHEMGLVESLEDLDEGSAAALRKALEASGFVMIVSRILSIESEHDVRNWLVETKGGQRRFQTRMGSWPRKLDSGGVLIHDVAEDMYLIPDSEALDDSSRKILWAFSD